MAVLVEELTSLITSLLLETVLDSDIRWRSPNICESCHKSLEQNSRTSNRKAKSSISCLRSRQYDKCLSGKFIHNILCDLGDNDSDRTEVQVSRATIAGNRSSVVTTPGSFIGRDGDIDIEVVVIQISNGNREKWRVPVKLGYARIPIPPSDIISNMIVGIERHEPPPLDLKMAETLMKVHALDVEAKMTSNIVGLQYPQDLRLLDVNLMRIQTFHRPVKYIALSYVWEKPQSNAQLTESTEHFFRDIGSLGLGDYKIPDHIKCAIMICHKLKVQYLWIDRFCINQEILQEFPAKKKTSEKEPGGNKTNGEDSNENSATMMSINSNLSATEESKKRRKWETKRQRELKRINTMHHIYYYAHLTICLALEGEYGDSIPGFSWSDEPIFANHPTESDRDYIKTIRLLSQDQSKGAQLRSPWTSRGWTLQERFFSHSRLVITDVETVFEYEDGYYQESHNWLMQPANSRKRKYKSQTPNPQAADRAPQVLPSSPSSRSDNQDSHNDQELSGNQDLRKHLYLMSFKPSYQKIAYNKSSTLSLSYTDLDSGKPSMGNLHKLFRIIADYSRRDLTIEKDTIRAFLGIANYIRVIWDTAFYNHHPEFGFLQSLLWKRATPGGKETCRDKDLNTWCWPRVKGIYYDDEEDIQGQARSIVYTLYVLSDDDGPQLIGTQHSLEHWRTTEEFSSKSQRGKSPNAKLPSQKDHKLLNSSENSGALLIRGYLLEWNHKMDNTRDRMVFYDFEWDDVHRPTDYYFVPLIVSNFKIGNVWRGLLVRKCDVRPGNGPNSIGMIVKRVGMAKIPTREFGLESRHKFKWIIMR